MPEERDEQMCGDMKAEEAVEKFMGLIVNTTKDLYYEFKYPIPKMNHEEMAHGANIQNRVPWKARTENARMRCDFEDVRQLVSISFIEDICKRYDPTKGAHFAYFAQKYLKGNARRWIKKDCIKESDTDLAKYRVYREITDSPGTDSDDEVIQKIICLVNMCLDQCEFTDKEEEVLYLTYDMDYIKEHGSPRQQTEIADILGLTRSAVNQRMKKVRAKLNPCIVKLDKEGVC